MKMTILKLSVVLGICYCPIVLAQEVSDDLWEIKRETLKVFHENYDESIRLLNTYLDSHKNQFDQRSFQMFYHFYARILFIHRDYKESVDMLKMAIDKFDSDAEPYLVKAYEDYKQYLSKPRLEINPWPNDQESCEVLKGIWKPGNVDFPIKQGYCNLPTTDWGRNCTDSTQCQGMCATNKNVPRGTKVFGKCSERIGSTDGCANTVINGNAQGQICD